MASKSPVSAVSQHKSSSAPETPSRAIPTSPQTVPFPSPQTFDFIPPLHTILLRLLSSAQAANQTNEVSTTAPEAAGDVLGAAPTGVASLGPSGQPQQPQQQKSSQQPASQQAIPTASATVAGAADTTLLSSNARPPLDTKDLPTATSAIKIRIQKARAVIESLPDMDRTVEDQEQEIDDLQDRIARLKSVVAEFGRRAGTQQDDRMDTAP